MAGGERYRMRPEPVGSGWDYVVELCVSPEKDLWDEEYRDLWPERAQAVCDALNRFTREHPVRIREPR